MGIFSFGKKDDAPTRRGANTSSNRAARGERVERRTRRTERPVDADAMLLDPTLPEKQRARRRLVGAIALVVAAVIILPMVLDSHPKPVTDDISIDIPSRPAPKVSRAVEDTQAGVAPDNPTPDAGLAASALAPATAANSGKSSTKQGTDTTAAASTPATKPAAAKPQAPATAVNAAPAAPVAAVKPAARTPSTQSSARNTESAATAGDEDTNTAAASAIANSGTPASPPGSRFAVQLGAFADESNARNWASRLKAAGVPAYTEHRKQADGTTLTLLRAGPFADRAAATAAIQKVRAAGLTSGSNSGTAQ
ncbi:DedD protein [Paraburkholderia sp. GAS333]|uniref:SPOR domain-containing protein n=1 Tax=Paraburkholderia sp. GAS333 TaxID=3156279 RepID=UPI003D1C9D26